jgi:hypothetical protein
MRLLTCFALWATVGLPQAIYEQVYVEMEGNIRAPREAVDLAEWQLDRA